MAKLKTIKHTISVFSLNGTLENLAVLYDLMIQHLKYYTALVTQIYFYENITVKYLAIPNHFTESIDGF